MTWDIDIANLLAIVVCDCLILGLLTYRRAWRILPMFCSYCAWDLISNCGGLAVSRYYPAIYFQVYFAQVVIDSALQLCVLVELAWAVLRPIRANLPRTALPLIGILILVAGAAIWPFATLQGLEHATSRTGFLFAQLQQTVSILRILFFLLLAGGSQLLSIGWRDRELQVASGLGLFSIVSLTVAVIQTHQTNTAEYVRLGRFVTIGYVCCLFYWIVSFAQKEAERREFTPQMQKFLLAVAGATRSARVGFEDSRGGKPRNPNDR
jgi:hypothetical protein